MVLGPRPLPEVDHFATFISDITPSRRAEKEVEAYRRKISLLGSSVRHDVLNQLTALNGFITLSQLKVEDRAVQEFLNKAATSGGRIRRILERSREFEQLGSSPPEWISVQKAAEQGVRQVSGESTVVRVELHGLEVLADPHLDMVFRTICDNARCHGHATEVRFFLETDEHGVRVICQDNGVGISPEKRKGLFSERLDHNLFLVKECLSITGLEIEERPMEGEPVFR